MVASDWTELACYWNNSPGEGFLAGEMHARWCGRREVNPALRGDFESPGDVDAIVVSDS